MEVPLLEVYKLDQTTITSNPPQTLVPETKPETTTATQELCPPITTVYKTNTKYSFGSVKYKMRNGLGQKKISIFGFCMIFQSFAPYSVLVITKIIYSLS